MTAMLNASAPRAAEGSSSPTPQDRVRVLVVDDEPEVLNTLNRQLRRDFEVLIAHDAEAALALLDQHCVQVIISDERMPRITGCQLLTQVRERNPHIVRLLLTGYADLAVVIEAINQGHIYRYITKPWNAVEIRTIVREAGERYWLRIHNQQLLDELRLLNEQLEHKVEIRTAEARAASAAKSEFLAQMSHEIRTPLNGVLGLAQVLSREPLAPNQRALVERIQASGQTLLMILNDILDFSKIEAGQLRIERRPFNLASVLTRIKNLLGPAARSKGLELRIAPPADPLGLLLGDGLRLEQVLVNLTGNAIKFTEQGVVTLTIQVLEASATDVWLRFEVRDTGIGLSSEALARLFTPFTQADAGITRRYGGTGLGLSICKRLMELMGGVIRVESQVGQGSLFWFELPFPRTAGESMPDPGPALAWPAKPQLTGLQVLVVDDSAINREVVERALALEGATVMLAADGQQAVQQLKARPEGFDAVLMDVQMPVLDGLTATRLIRSDLGLTALPILALTAGGLADQQAAAREAGANAVLTKPLDLEQLTTTLLRWVKRQPEAAAPALGQQLEDLSVASAPWPQQAADPVPAGPAHPGKTPAAAAPDTPLRSLDTAILHPKVRALAAMLEIGQNKARKLSAEIEALLAGTELQKPYAPIAQAIAHLNFEAALNDLRALAQQQGWNWP
ncbi:MAG TPA: response regulator [Candidatus Contendobacter sp.]|nr:response regulator [Candidatus Contendobacter sp.]